LKQITIYMLLIVFGLLFTMQISASDIESLPDATVVESVPENAIVQTTVDHEDTGDTASLPDAIVVDVQPVEIKRVAKPHKTHKRRKHRKYKRKEKQPKVNLDEIPDADVVEVFDIDANGNLIPRKSSAPTVQQKKVTVACPEKCDTPPFCVKKTPVAAPVAVEEHIVCPSADESKSVELHEVSPCVTQTVVPDTNKIVKEEKERKPIPLEEPVVTKQAEPEPSPIVIVKTIAENPESEKQIGFWELLDKTLENSARLILKKYDIALRRENMEVLKSEYYPNISLGYSGEYYHSFSKGSSADIGGQYYPSYSQYRDSLGVNMRYEVYRFGATDLKMEISRKELEIIKNELRLDQEKVSKELLQYFTQALKAQKSIRYKEQMQAIYERILKKQKRLYHAGRVPKTEIMKSERALISLDKEILQHKLDLTEAIKNIQILSNIELDPDQVDFLMLEPKNSATKSFEESARAKNLALQIEVKKQELELIEKDYYPTVNMNSGYRFYGSDEKNFFKSVRDLRRNSWDVGVSANWNLFDGHKTDHMITKKKIELQQLQERYRLAKIDFEAQEKKRELLKKALDKILKSEINLVSQTEEQKELYARLHAAGKANTLQVDYIQIDILKSELSFKLNVIERVYETILSELTR